MAAPHDLPEVIATDFTPQDTITKADKGRIEMLAAKVIFEAHPDMLALAEEYEAQETPGSHIVHDVDTLDAVRMALVYEGMHLKKRGQLYPEFAAYAEPRLKTDLGRAESALLAETQEAIRMESWYNARDDRGSMLR